MKTFSFDSFDCCLDSNKKARFVVFMISKRLFIQSEEKKKTSHNENT
jgi:hypothetical protein